MGNALSNLILVPDHRRVRVRARAHLRPCGERKRREAKKLAKSRSRCRSLYDVNVQRRAPNPLSAARARQASKPQLLPNGSKGGSEHIDDTTVIIIVIIRAKAKAA